MPGSCPPSGEAKGAAARRILFATPCRWIKLDHDPDRKLDFAAPLRGTLFVTESALEFSGYYKSYGGNLRATMITALLVRLIGEVTASIPLGLIRQVEAIPYTAKFLFMRKEAVRLEILYAPDWGSPVRKKIVCFPHFGLAPEPDPERFHIEPELQGLYQPGPEACNWERVLRYLAGAA